MPASPFAWGLCGLPWYASSCSLSLNVQVPLPGQCVPEHGHALAQGVHCTLEFSNKLIIAYFKEETDNTCQCLFIVKLKVGCDMTSFYFTYV